ncbi:MAG: hypothetical protein WD200_04150 [Candidatus Andersenbacteria bacterium]
MIDGRLHPHQMRVEIEALQELGWIYLPFLSGHTAAERERELRWEAEAAGHLDAFGRPDPFEVKRAFMVPKHDCPWQLQQLNFDVTLVSTPEELRTELRNLCQEQLLVVV